MKRIDLLFANPEYQNLLEYIKYAERDRKFCRHDIRHFLDMSRLLYIYCLEEGLDIDKELIYAIGLLHDIGRAEQYKSGREHHLAGAECAKKLMPLCGFTNEETQRVAEAILSHRSTESGDILARLVYRADKRSRLCFDCPARDECNWPREKMNLEIDI